MAKFFAKFYVVRDYVGLETMIDGRRYNDIGYYLQMRNVGYWQIKSAIIFWMKINPLICSYKMLYMWEHAHQLLFYMANKDINIWHQHT